MNIAKYVIEEKGDNYFINDIEIPDVIFNEEKVEYRIEDRETLIDNLIMWISESKTSDKELMKDDLKLLINLDDEFVLSSISTNDYLYGNSERFNEQCQAILNEIK